jgi:hypothetical protein
MVNAAGESGVERHWSVRAYRKSKGHWKYPVHNQLLGLSNVIPCDALVKTSYQGSMEQKSSRSIPMLLRCYEADPTDGHAPFFLAKTYTALDDHENALRWCRVCEEVCGDEPRYAGFWIWYFQSEIATAGREAAAEVIETALALHPGFPDLWHCRMNLDAMRWLETGSKPGPYLFASIRSAAVFTDVRRIKAGWDAFDFPVRLEIKGE